MSRRRTILEAAARVVALRGVRGLRVEEIAAEAGVSTALIYYHFKDRAGLLGETLDFVNDRAERYTEPATAFAEDPVAHIEETLLLELRDTPLVRENSTAWGESRASAVFQPELRERLRAATGEWNAHLAGLIRAAQDAGGVRASVDAEDAAERLSALVEGLSMRWLSGGVSPERARRLLSGAVAAELRT
ncbi:putative transcriptional regulator, TetR family protein [Actinorhabdospora filicis]|uniref:Transcriptional regulator, TetR family protein n=1 Tax=Actinorhabdospora filicis TaxID=1785913 RepID=A0A9W6SET8_9ACTN|nr:TetR/AcrR family transcriptional regulator [Actinorhabdospora filicis]GLZ75884.1 putative transcriptional regulator, TetR family protein [Actinorhabdospora filicis]